MVVIKPWETPGTLKDLEGEGRAGGEVDLSLLI